MAVIGQDVGQALAHAEGLQVLELATPDLMGVERHACIAVGKVGAELRLVPEPFIPVRT